MTKTISTRSVSGESTYVRKTSKQIKELATDVIAGMIYGSWMFRDGDWDSHLTFMPLMFMTDIQAKELQRDGAFHLYGHMNDACERSVNGRPIFFSFQTLSKEDTERLGKMIDKIMAIEEEEDE